MKSWTITGSSIVGTETDSLSGFEYADLTGGASANTINASGFTGLFSTTTAYQLNKDQGLGVVHGRSTLQPNWKSTTPLLALGKGTETSVADGDDFQVTLTDGSTVVNVDLRSTDTLEDTLNAITNAHARLTASLDDSGTAIQLVDSQDEGSDLVVTSLGSSTVAAVLGIEGTAQATTLRGLPLSILNSDLRIVLNDGTAIDIDLDHAATIQDILDAITNSHPKLSATLDAAKVAIEVTDTSGGSGTLEIENLNGSTTATILGINKAASAISPATITGDPIGIARVAIDGKGGDDVITGSPGNDSLTGGEGADVIDGAGGKDTIVETRNKDMDLTDANPSPGHDASLSIGNEGTDLLTSIETAILTGGVGVNNIDASGFTAGSVTLGSGGGLDTLIGTNWDDEFIIQVGELPPPNDENDSEKQVAITVGSSTDDTVIIQGSGPNLTQEDMNWVNLNCQSECTEFVFTAGQEDYEPSSNFTVNSPVETNGKSIRLEAPSIIINSDIITTTADGTKAGDITLSGEHITIDGGATLNAKATLPANHGKIHIDAYANKAFISDGDQHGFLGFYNNDVIDVDITIGHATIQGGVVEIDATADGLHYFRPGDNSDPADAASFFKENVGEGFLGLIEGLAVGVAVSYSDASAVIQLGSGSSGRTTIDGTRVSVVSDVSSRAQTYSVPPVGKLKKLNPYKQIGFGVSKASSNVDIKNATITTETDLTVRAQSNPSVRVQADSPEKIPLVGSRMSPAMALSEIDSTTTVHIHGDVQLEVAGNLYVQADTNDQSATTANSAQDSSGNVGIAFAKSVENGTTTAILEGDVHVAGNVNVVAKHDESPLKPHERFYIYTEEDGVKATAGTYSTLKSQVLWTDSPRGCLTGSGIKTRNRQIKIFSRPNGKPGRPLRFMSITIRHYHKLAVTMEAQPPTLMRVDLLM